MKVTKIQQQQKRADRYSIYIDGTYHFSLSDYQLIGSGITVGREYTNAELAKLIQESNFGKAYERALNYVMIRPRSEKEILNYLQRTFLYPKPRMVIGKTGQRHLKKQVVDKMATSIMIERVMGRLREKGYINDESFAKAWVHSRRLTKNMSRRRLEQELQLKGINSQIIATQLQNDSETEVDALRELIQKKRRQSRYQDELKLTQYLLRQGFKYDDIRHELGPS